MAATKYVRSAATGAGTGANWTDAYTTLQLGMTNAGAGGTVYVSEDHSEQAAATLTLSCPGIIGSPQSIYCVSHTGSVPPVSADLRTTAVVGTTGAFSLTWTASSTLNNLYCYGIIWSTGSSSSVGSQTWPMGRADMEACTFKLNNTATTSTFNIGGTTTGLTAFNLLNCAFVFGNASQTITQKGGRIFMKFGSIALTGTAPSNAFGGGANQISATTILEGVDLTGLSGVHLFGSSSVCSYGQIKNCKLPASITVAFGLSGNQIVDNIYSDSTTTNTRVERFTSVGSFANDTTVSRSGGATDGVTPYSWGTDGGSTLLGTPFECPEIGVWNSLTGSSRTATIEVLTDGVTLDNSSCWVDLYYMGSSATPVSSRVTTGFPDTLSTTISSPTTLPTSSKTWNGTAAWARQCRSTFRSPSRRRWLVSCAPW